MLSEIHLSMQRSLARFPGAWSGFCCVGPPGFRHSSSWLPVGLVSLLFPKDSVQHCKTLSGLPRFCPNVGKGLLEQRSVPISSISSKSSRRSPAGAHSGSGEAVAREKMPSLAHPTSYPLCFFSCAPTFSPQSSSDRESILTILRVLDDLLSIGESALPCLLAWRRGEGWQLDAQPWLVPGVQAAWVCSVPFPWERLN